MDYKKLGERIRRARKKLRISQEQFGGEIGYSVPHVSHVENARTTLSVDFLVKASNALHVSADQLLCDSLKYTNDVYKGEIMEALEDCSQMELIIISQTVMDLKRTLRKNIGADDDEKGTVR